MSGKFEQLSIDEVAKELKEFRSKDELLKVWQKGEKLSWQAKIREVHSSPNKCTINILPLSNLEIDKSKSILINFQKKNTDFFCETRFVSQNGSIFEFEILDKNYRVEKRAEPRFICYPSMEIYFVVEIPFPENDEGEILSFYKEKREEVEFLKDFREKVLKIKNPHKKENVESINLRVLDISVGGVACYCSDDEYEFFNLKNNIKSAYILHNGKVFNITVKNLIYEVEYFNPFARSIGMKKIGIEIDKNPGLTEFLNSLDKSQSVLTQADKTFEDM